MNHDYLHGTDRVANVAGSDDLILLTTACGSRIEITEQNHLQLVRELAGTLEDPLRALMAEVALEYRQMGRAASARDSQGI